MFGTGIEREVEYNAGYEAGKQHGRRSWQREVVSGTAFFVEGYEDGFREARGLPAVSVWEQSGISTLVQRVATRWRQLWSHG